MKTCAKCGAAKNFPGDFHRDRSNKSGYCTYCKGCNKAKTKACRQASLDGYRAADRARRPIGAQEGANLLRKYGLTPDAYSALLASQGGGCGICGQQEPIEGRRLSVDHDHDSGVVRGVLCSSCNRGVGLLGDDAERLLAAANYLLASRDVLGSM